MLNYICMKYVVHYIFKAYTYPTINGYIFDIRCHVHYTQFQFVSTAIYLQQ